MTRTPVGLAKQLQEAGFSDQAIEVLIHGLGLSSLEELRSRPWEGTSPESPGLLHDLIASPNCGQEIVAEVMDYRERRGPRIRRARGPRRVDVPLDEALLAALDRWRAAQKKPPSRAAAITTLLRAALETPGWAAAGHC